MSCPYAGRGRNYTWEDGSLSMGALCRGRWEAGCTAEHGQALPLQKEGSEGMLLAEVTGARPLALLAGFTKHTNTGGGPASGTDSNRVHGVQAGRSAGFILLLRWMFSQMPQEQWSSNNPCVPRTTKPPPPAPTAPDTRSSVSISAPH